MKNYKERNIKKHKNIMYVQSRNQKIFSRNIFPNTPENPNAKQKKILGFDAWDTSDSNVME